jgi:hypothetical protein
VQSTFKHKVLMSGGLVLAGLLLFVAGQMSGRSSGADGFAEGAGVRRHPEHHAPPVRLDHDRAVR